MKCVGFLQNFDLSTFINYLKSKLDSKTKKNDHKDLKTMNDVSL